MYVFYFCTLRGTDVGSTFVSDLIQVSARFFWNSRYIGNKKVRGIHISALHWIKSRWELPTYIISILSLIYRVFVAHRRGACVKVKLNWGEQRKAKNDNFYISVMTLIGNLCMWHGKFIKVHIARLEEFISHSESVFLKKQSAQLVYGNVSSLLGSWLGDVWSVVLNATSSCLSVRHGFGNDDRAI